MNSEFCVLFALVKLASFGVYGSAVIKKRRFWPKYVQGTCDKTVALLLIKLSKRGFKICEEQYKKSSEYDCCSLLIDGTIQKEVRRRGGPSHSACLTNGKNCLCDMFVAYQVQCQHLFAFHKGKFQLQLVDSKFHAQPLSASSPNPDYTTILSAWCVTRDPYIGSLGNKLFGQRSSTVPSSPPTSPVPTMGVMMIMILHKIIMTRIGQEM
jgi:hypothetical protein